MRQRQAFLCGAAWVLLALGGTAACGDAAAAPAERLPVSQAREVRPDPQDDGFLLTLPAPVPARAAVKASAPVVTRQAEPRPVPEPAPTSKGEPRAKPQGASLPEQGKGRVTASAVPVKPAGKADVTPPQSADKRADRQADQKGAQKTAQKADQKANQEADKAADKKADKKSDQRTGRTTRAPADARGTTPRQDAAKVAQAKVTSGRTSPAKASVDPERTPRAATPPALSSAKRRAQADVAEAAETGRGARRQGLKGTGAKDAKARQRAPERLAAQRPALKAPQRAGAEAGHGTEQRHAVQKPGQGTQPRTRRPRQVDQVDQTAARSKSTATATPRVRQASPAVAAGTSRGVRVKPKAVPSRVIAPRAADRATPVTRASRERASQAPQQAPTRRTTRETAPRVARHAQEKAEKAR